MSYLVTPPRSRAAAIADLTPPGSRTTLHELCSALTVLPRFGTPRRHDIKTLESMAHSWTYDAAKNTVVSCLGVVAPRNLTYFHAFYPTPERVRSDPEGRKARDWTANMALVLGSGWDGYDVCHWRIDDQWQPTPLALLVQWVTFWDMSTLTACINAGLTLSELDAVVAARQLPDPDQIAFLTLMQDH